MLSTFRPIAIGLVLALGAAQAVAASSSPSPNATGQPEERQYTNGPVTEVDYIHVEYGGFAKYVNWLNSTWKPTMEALKKAGDNHRLQGFPVESKITGSAQCVSLADF